MSGHQRRFNHYVVRIGIVSTMLYVTGCASINIRAPANNERLTSTTNTFQVEKRDGNCSYNGGSFQAVIDPGAGQTNISSMFTGPVDDQWTANDVTLPVGSHTLKVQARFSGSVCRSGQTVSDTHQFEVRPPVTGVITYTTDCGTGEFTYEPYPIVLPPGAKAPPVFPIPSDAHCVSPGTSMRIDGITLAYPDLVDVQRLEFAVLHTRYDPDALDAGGSPGVWSRLRDPTYFNITSFSHSGNTINLDIPADISAQPPAAATIRMTYADQSGRTRVVDIEAERRPTVFAHGLYFIPEYKVYLGRAKVSIGFDLFDHTVDGVAMQTFSSLYPQGWERYCRIRYQHFSTSGFPGTVSFTSPDALIRVPTQGYRVQMPGTRTGSFEILYQVVCPVDLPPTGHTLFSSWGLLGDYNLSTGENYIHGMPPITNVARP